MLVTRARKTRGGDTATTPADDRQHVVRIDGDRTERERGLEAKVLAEGVEVELRVAIGIGALDREVLGRIDAAVPFHTSDLGRIARTAGEHIGRRTDRDAADTARLTNHDSSNGELEILE